MAASLIELVAPQLPLNRVQDLLEVPGSDLVGYLLERGLYFHDLLADAGCSLLELEQLVDQVNYKVEVLVAALLYHLLVVCLGKQFVVPLLAEMAGKSASYVRVLLQGKAVVGARTLSEVLAVGLVLAQQHFQQPAYTIAVSSRVNLCEFFN